MKINKIALSIAFLTPAYQNAMNYVVKINDTCVNELASLFEKNTPEYSACHRFMPGTPRDKAKKGLALGLAGKIAHESSEIESRQDATNSESELIQIQRQSIVEGMDDSSTAAALATVLKIKQKVLIKNETARFIARIYIHFFFKKLSPDKKKSLLSKILKITVAKNTFSKK